MEKRQIKMRKSGRPKLNLRDMCVEATINGALYKHNLVVAINLTHG